MFNINLALSMIPLKTFAYLLGQSCFNFSYIFEGSTVGSISEESQSWDDREYPGFFQHTEARCLEPVYEI